MISKSSKYAIRAVTFIASKTEGNRKLSIKEIASEIEAPPAFAGKILQKLTKNKIVTSLKGPYGGFFCEKYQLELQVSEVVKIFDGLAVFEECVMGLHQCSDTHPCPMHFDYIKTRNFILNTFQNTTIGQLAKNFSEGGFFLKNP